MTPEMIIEILRNALLTAFWLSAPLLLIAFVVGILLSLLQIVTSIQDTAFSTIPRLIAFLVSIVALLPWMLSKSMSYTTVLFSDFGRYAK